jgi:hypothetical protein
MSEIVNYPLTWPNNVPRTAPQSRGFPQFYEPTSFAGAARHALQEINRLNRRHFEHLDEDVIISSNWRRNLDGRITANQPEPADPGIAIYFKLRYLRHTRDGLKEFDKPCVLTCDKWRKTSFNVEAIARDIEAQRARSRWGCTSVEQAFQGYLAIPEKCGGKAWWDLLKVPSTATKEQIKESFNFLAQIAHPDKGGSHDEWVLLQDAFNQAMAA